jgi:predicted ATPase
MKPERWREVERVLGDALAVEQSQRVGFLDRECSDDEELRLEVESLLALEGRTWAFIETPALEQVAGWSADPTVTIAGGPLAAGATLGPYRIEAELGAGGMGRVYLARDTRLGRGVALKLLAEGLLGNEAMARRFEREARAASSLNHPNIVTIYGVGEAEGLPYIAAEYVEGETLRRRLARGRLQPREALDVARQVARALEAAHAAGVVHRDVKPENLMLRPDGMVKVLDFGIAKLLRSQAKEVTALTAPGRVIGTAAYMSPEQARGLDVDARTDLWSLGAVLYEMLSGRPPFRGDTQADLLAAILRAEPEPLTGVPRPVCQAVERCLRENVEERFATAGELAEELNRLARSEPDEAPAALSTGSADSGPLVGRERELRAVTAEVRRPEARLVTLTGPGGTGKTRLALAAARALEANFADGVFFVDLSVVRDSALVAPVIARELGVKEAGTRPLTEGLEHFLRERHVLLVLDNFEQVLDAAELLAQLLGIAPGVKAIVTSRAPLRLRIEREFAVPSLAVPSAEELPAVDGLARYGAVALFVERARAARRGFALTAENAGAVAEICRRLDGLPLAIELAAARVMLLSPEGLLARLADRLDLLASRVRDLPERQRTMRGAIAWSYDLLDESERRVFERLAVFAGGCTLAAAESVVGDETGVAGESPATAAHPVPRSSVLDAVESLVEKSLVVRGEGEEPRVRMLEVVREYALERLRARGEADGVARRHADYFLALAEVAVPELARSEAAEWLGRLEEEHDNLRAALEWLRERDACACLRLAAALRNFWSLRGHWSEGRLWLEAALDRGADAPVRTRLLAHGGAAVLAQYRGDLEAARRHFELCVRIGREIGDDVHVNASSHGLGVVAFRQGDVATARAYFQAGEARARESGESRLLAQSLVGLADIARLEGDWAAACSGLAELVTILRREGVPSILSTALSNFGAAACEAGDLTTATACYREALTLSEGLGFKSALSYTLGGLGAVAARRGAPERAARLAGAAEALREDIGYELEPADRAFRDRYVAETRAALGEAAFAEATAEGRAMTLGEAVRLGLRESESDP